MQFVINIFNLLLIFLKYLMNFFDNYSDCSDRLNIKFHYTMSLKRTQVSEKLGV